MSNDALQGGSSSRSVEHARNFPVANACSSSVSRDWYAQSQSSCDSLAVTAWQSCSSSLMVISVDTLQGGGSGRSDRITNGARAGASWASREASATSDAPGQDYLQAVGNTDYNTNVDIGESL